MSPSFAPDFWVNLQFCGWKMHDPLLPFRVLYNGVFMSDFQNDPGGISLDLQKGLRTAARPRHLGGWRRGGDRHGHTERRRAAALLLHALQQAPLWQHPRVRLWSGPLSPPPPVRSDSHSFSSQSLLERVFLTRARARTTHTHTHTHALPRTLTH